MEIPQLGRFPCFEQLAGSTHCPYANRATIKYAPEPYSRASSKFNRHLPILQRWLAEPLTDAVVIAISVNEIGQNLDEHARTFAGLMELLSDKPISNDVLSPGWQMTVGAVRVFVSMFSQTYPKTNPRFVPCQDYAYVMLQPEKSFHRLLPRDRLDEVKRGQIKLSIRKAFENAGMPYDPLDREPPTEAQKYVKPLLLGDAMVEWWTR